MTATAFKRAKFSDGEGLVAADLEQLQVFDQLRAWEVPGYANAIAFDVPWRTYQSVFAGDVALNSSLLRGVFTKGGGLEISSSGLTSSVSAGMIGVWQDEAGYVSAPPRTAEQHFRWSMIDGWSHVHAAAGTGLFRWDLISVRITDVASDDTPRDMKDSTSGAVTTQSIKKSYAATLDLSDGTSVTSLPESATPTAPVLADVPAGRRVLYAIKVSDSTIVDRLDYSIPFGPLIRCSQLGVEALRSGITGEAWDPYVGAITPASSTSHLAMFPPSAIMGDSSVRILGAEVRYVMTNAADSLELYKYYLDGSQGSRIKLGDITTTKDSTAHTVYCDWRGLPGYGSGPLWGNGHTHKQPPSNQVPASSPAIYVTLASGGEIRSVTWYAIRG